MKFVTVLLFLSSALVAAPQTAKQIIESCNDKNDEYKSLSSDLELAIISANGSSSIRKLKGDTLQGSKAGSNKTLLTFMYPTDVKGTKLLTHTVRGEGSSQWLYLPAFKRVKRISGRSRSGSFMGSEFTFEDIGGDDMDKFTYQLIAQEKFEKRDIWKIKKTPLDENKSYKNQVVFLDKAFCLALKVEYYDLKDKLYKVATFSDIEFKNKIHTAKKVVMKNLMTKKSSELSWKKLEFDKNMSESQFSKAKLSR